MNKLTGSSPKEIFSSAVQLAALAKRNGWTSTELWNMYENTKQKFPIEQQHTMYNTVSTACEILQGFHK